MKRGEGGGKGDEGGEGKGSLCLEILKRGVQMPVCTRGGGGGGERGRGM